MFFYKIKLEREKKNISTEFIAIEMDISVKEYLKIEKGEVDLKLSKLDKITKILGLKKSDLFVVQYS